MGRKPLMCVLACYWIGAAPILGRDAELDRIAASAPGRDRYPDADAVLLKEVRTVSLDREGKRSERIYRLVKILTPQGRGLFADPRFPFEEARQTFRVIRARTRMRDGTIVNTPDNGINTVTPRAVAGAPAYASRREAVVSHVGIEMDALLELEVEIADLKGGRKSIDGVEVFGDRVPVLEKTLVVEVPRGVALKWEVAGSEWFQPGRAETGDEGRWTLKAVPAYPDEPHSPPRAEVCPRVLYSTWPSWKGWVDAFASKLDDPASALLPKDLLKSLDKAADKHSLAETIAAVDALLARRVRVVHAPADGAFPRAPKDVWAEGYGNGPDRASLFCAAFKHLAIPARPVWVASSRGAVPANVPLPCLLDSVWVRVRRGDREWWIDPLQRVTATGFLPPRGRGRFAPGAEDVPGGVETGESAPDRSAVVTGSVRLREDGSMTAFLFMALEGRVNPALRVLAGEGELRGIVAEKLRSLWKEAKIRKWIVVQATAEKTQVAIECEAADAVTLEGGLRVFTLPETLFLPSFAPPRANRRLPFRFGEILSETVELNVTYPPSWKLSASPATVSGEIKGAFRIGILAWEREKTLCLFRSFKTLGGDVGVALPAPSDTRMKELRSLLSAWKAEAGRTVIFETP